MSDFNFENVLALYHSTEDFPVHFELGWEWLLFSRKDSAKRSFESCGFVEGVDFIRFHRNVESGAVMRDLEFIQMTIDCFKSWSMMVGTERGKEVRKYFLDCEKALKEERQVSHRDMLTLIRQEMREIIAPEMEEIRKYKKVCEDHKGTGSVIQSDVDDKKYPLETISINEYCRQKGIESSLWLTISKRYGQFVRVGKIEPPKDKGKLLVCGNLYSYAEAALKSVLDID